MKKVTAERRSYLSIVTRKRTVRALKSKGKAHRRRCTTSLQLGRTPSQRRRWQRRSRRVRRSSEYLVAPKEFGISIASSNDQVRTEFVQFIRQLKRIALNNRRRVFIDFNNASRMYPDGVLLFAATLDLINRETHPKRLVRCNYPKDDVVEQLFQHLGLLAWMGKADRVAVSAENVRYWRVASDTTVNGERTVSVVEEYERLFSSHEARKLYGGLTEAMTNCKHHAYESQRYAGACVDTRWWMFSQIRDDVMSVVICDLGIGIPSSLKQGRRWGLARILEVVDGVGWGRKDSAFISAAMVLGRTRTHEEYRGKGLPELKGVIESLRDGYLKIYSGKGTYYFNGSTQQEDLKDSVVATPGTLIQWQVPLPKAGSK